MFKDNLIINSKIEKGKRIGNGQFGEVFKGNENYHNFYQIIFTIVFKLSKVVLLLQSTVFSFVMYRNISWAKRIPRGCNKDSENHLECSLFSS